MFLIVKISPKKERDPRLQLLASVTPTRISWTPKRILAPDMVNVIRRNPAVLPAAELSFISTGAGIAKSKGGQVFTS